MARKLINTKEISHDEWLTLRKKSIGGSDAGAIVGMNSYASAVTVYCDKLGLSKVKEEQSEAMRLGTDLEGYVAQRFTELTGKKVRNDNFMYQHDEYDFITANIDRVVVGENAGLECKTMSGFASYDFENGDVPAAYFCQCQHYMAVMGFNKMYLCVLQFQKGVFVVEIDRDQKFIDELIEAECRFWHDNVEAHIMPAPDDSDATSEMLQELWPEQNKGMEIELPSLQNDAKRYLEISEMEKQLKEQKNEIANRIKAEMQDAEKATSEGYYTTWKSQSRESFDSKLKDDFKEKHPDLYKKYFKRSDSRVLRVSAVKAKKGA